MRILLIMDQYDNANNGTTISANRFAAALRQRGHQVRVVSTGSPSPEKFPVPARRFPRWADRIISGQGMTLARPDREVLTRAISWAEIVHFMMPFSLSVAGVKIARQMGRPYTAAFHVQPENVTYSLGLGRCEEANRFLYWLFHQQFYQYCRHIHCPSRFIAQELEAHGYEAKLHVFSNGVDPCFQYRKQEKTGRLAGKMVLLMVGRLSPEKRQDVLIRAAARSRYADRIQLVFAGKGLQQEKYERMGRTLAHPPIFRFCTQAELMELMAMSDLYVHTADVEIEAISCIEAFSSGLVPVIADSPKSATRQFALTPENLFQPGDSADLAGKIDYWLDHEQQRREMERRYADYGLQFGLDRSVQQAEEMFRQAMERPRLRPEEQVALQTAGDAGSWL